MTTHQSKTLSKPQQKVLSALSNANPEKGILTHDLACQTPFTVTDTRLRLQQLERRGLVVSAPWQLRQIRWSLTPEGVAAVKALTGRDGGVSVSRKKPSATCFVYGKVVVCYQRLSGFVLGEHMHDGVSARCDGARRKVAAEAVLFPQKKGGPQ